MLRRILWFLFFLAMALHLGGMVALGVIAAPAIFRTVRANEAVLPGMPPWVNATDQLGGEIFGEVLMRFRMIETAALAIMGLVVLLELALYVRGKWSLSVQVVRAALVAAVATLVIYDAASLTPTVWETRTRWRQAADVNQAAALKTDFDRLHKRSENLGRVRVYLLLALLGVSVAAIPLLPRPLEKPREGEVARA